MSSRFDLLTQQLFEKDFSDCTLDELDRYAAAHPYLAAAHFLVVKKLQVEQNPEYRTRAQKAALYHHQPFLLEAFLAEAAPVAIPVTEQAPELPAISEQEVRVVEEQAAAPDSEDLAIAEETMTQSKDEERTVPMPVLPRLDAPVTDTGFTFEPFHTVDYFASLGIKLSQEEVTKDKFGKQLKSFTEWLKTMKKLPSAEQAKNMDPQAEKKVEHMAAHSVSTAEVVTETMAEIWARQGQHAKAAELYRKLSLLHPSKKAYFASKLDQLEP